MSSQQDKKPDENEQAIARPPDNRGPRPTDPNALAKWIVEQVTQDDEAKNDSTKNAQA